MSHKDSVGSGDMKSSARDRTSEVSSSERASIALKYIISDAAQSSGGFESGAESNEELGTDDRRSEAEDEYRTEAYKTELQERTMASLSKAPSRQGRLADFDSDTQEAESICRKPTNIKSRRADEATTPSQRFSSRQSSSASHLDSEGQTDNLSSEIETDDSAEAATTMTYRQWKILRGDPPRSKQLRRGVGYRDAYRLLLNEDINRVQDLSELQDDRDSDRFQDSLIGAALWTGRDKAVFFEAVARRGRNDLPFIAQQTGKSLLEVQQLILLFEQGVSQSITKPIYDSGYGFDQNPAAVELSERLCERLEQAADTIARYQNKKEANVEANKHGCDWLIDWSQSGALEQQGDAEGALLAEDAEPVATTHESQGASTSFDLLHPRNFLRLSSRIFMASSEPERDWETYDKYGPAMYTTAMQDFQQLVINLTKRIIYTAALQAQSRYRASSISSPSNGTEKTIRKRDVEGALQILGLKQDTRAYWAELPRRLGLTCFWNKRMRKGQEATAYRVSTRDAEAWLLQDAKKFNVEGLPLIHVRSRGQVRNADREASIDADGKNQGGQQQARHGEPEVHPLDHTGGNFRFAQGLMHGESPAQEYQSGDADLQSDEGTSMMEFPPRTSRSSSLSEESVNRKESIFHDLDFAAEIHDEIQASTEERLLWNMLDLTPPEGARGEAVPEVKVHPKSRRRETVLQHLEDWRLSFEYQPEWASTMHRKRKREMSVDCEEVGERQKLSYHGHVIPAIGYNHDLSSSELGGGSIASVAADEGGDTNNLNYDAEMQIGAPARRSSLPRRSSQIALDNLQASLDLRSELDNDLSSGDSYTPI